MLFNSIEFLIFFPVVLLIYFVLPAKVRYIWLLISSYYFYMCWNPVYVLLIVISTGITYLCGITIEYFMGRLKQGKKEKRQIKLIVLLGILSNLGILIYFKYTNFLMEIISPVLRFLHIKEVPVFDILLPVGISFYTFQALGYMIDVYRREIKAERNFLKYALFVSFFPQLVAGPIERSKNLLNQIKEEPDHKLWNYDRVVSGLITMLWGFFLKLVIADRVAVLVDTVFSGYEQYQMSALWAGAIGFAIQIYCDFSGYSTIAVGAAKVLGFELTENFNTPYFSGSVAEFWRRWHISLNSWFRDYLYIPLGGSKCSKWKRYRNILITFGVSGLWHGASWTYVVWGLLNGIYQIIEKEVSPVIDKLNNKYHTKIDSFGYKIFKVMFTFFLVDLAWIFFRADSIHQAVHYIQRMFLYRDWWSFFDLSIYDLGLNIQEMNILLIGVIILILVDLLRYKKQMTLEKFLGKQWIVYRWAVLLFLLFFCLVFGCYGPGFNSEQFIYFQF